jgi:serine/threonine protein kinase
MGKVYEARNNLLGGVPVAVKFLSQTLLNQKMRDRFMREATTCALLGQRSMHIVNVTDYGVDEDEIPYYVGYRARIRNHGHSCFLCEIVIRSQFHTTYEPEA